MVVLNIVWKLFISFHSFSCTFHILHTFYCKKVASNPLQLNNGWWDLTTNTITSMGSCTQKIAHFHTQLHWLECDSSRRLRDISCYLMTVIEKWVKQELWNERPTTALSTKRKFHQLALKWGNVVCLLSPRVWNQQHQEVVTFRELRKRYLVLLISLVGECWAAAGLLMYISLRSRTVGTWYIGVTDLWFRW